MILLDDIEEEICVISRDGKSIRFFDYDEMDGYREGEGNSEAAICALRVMSKVYGGMTIAELSETGRLSEPQEN